jgi:hypothetical protein
VVAWKIEKEMHRREIFSINVTKSSDFVLPYNTISVDHDNEGKYFICEHWMMIVSVNITHRNSIKITYFAGRKLRKGDNMTDFNWGWRKLHSKELHNTQITN